MKELPSIRLYVTQDLEAGCRFACDKGQANYLINVLRLAPGDLIAVFNGRDGEWLAELDREGKKGALLQVLSCLRSQTPETDLQYLFAPIKRGRLDYMVQKAVELGVSRLSPVITDFCQAQRVNLSRMQANAIEAAEQCGILRLPTIDKPVKLTDLLDEWDQDRVLVFCDEACKNDRERSVIGALSSLSGCSISVLIGPEGGFSTRERDLLGAQSFVMPISLGPRIMRADTAAVAALSLVNATVGDWL